MHTSKLLPLTVKYSVVDCNMFTPHSHLP